MSDSRSECERVQLALVQGLEQGWVAAHLPGCPECRFFRELSSQFSGASRMPTSGAASDLGSTFEALLDQAVEQQRPLARYRLDERLGRGGQGVVYRAIDTETGETIALKVVRSRAAGPEAAGAEVALAHLVPHPNVCRVYHTERHGDVRLIVMELVEGRRLDEAARALSHRERLRLFRQVCEAVSAAHEAGVLHLDLKPANILVRDSGSPVVTDFGLAARVSESAARAPRAGTPGYMAPEQVEGGPVDRRTDVYALGVILRELLPRPSRHHARLAERATDRDPARRPTDTRSLLREVDRPERVRRMAFRTTAAPAIAGAAWLAVGGVAKPTADVLVLGGWGKDGRWGAAAEVFDAERWAWRAIEPIPDPGQSAPRTCRMRAVRSGDEVLVLGGGAAAGCADDSATTNRVRIYSLATGHWSVPECQTPCVEHEGATFVLDRSERVWWRRWKKGACRPEGPCMLYGRNDFVAMTYANDDVLAYGGCAGNGNGPNELDQALEGPTPMGRMAEVYRRATRTWSSLPPSLLPRPRASAVNFANGPLVCGGFDPKGSEHDTCELLGGNQAIGAWKPAGRMPQPAKAPLMVSLGDVLLGLERDVVLGLQDGHAWLWKGKDWWDPDGWRWDESFFEPLPLPTREQCHGTLTRLPNGRALLVGGLEADRVVATAQLFTLGPEGRGGEWREVAPMNQARRFHVAVTLEDGRILVAGGCGPEPLASAEVYDPVEDRWTDAGRMPTARCGPEAVAVW